MLGKLTNNNRLDGTPYIEYTREQMVMRCRAISYEIGRLAEELATIASLLESQPNAKTFEL